LAPGRSPQLLSGIDHGADVGEELLSCLAEPGACAAALEDRHAEFTLQIANRGAERGLRDVKFFGGSAEGTDPGHCRHVLELLGSQRNPCLSIELVHNIQVHATAGGIERNHDRPGARTGGAAIACDPDQSSYRAV
jgi:hypothetical protein